MLVNFAFMTRKPIDRLLGRLSEMGKSEADFCREFGITAQRLNNWKKRGIAKHQLIPVATYIGRSAEWLEKGGPEIHVRSPIPLESTGDVEKLNVLTGPDIRGRIPLISWTQAGDFASLVDNYHPCDGEEWVKTTVPVKKHTFALRVVGDSMEPEFPEGAVIVVEPDMQADPGDFVVVRANGGTECTFKQLIKDGNDWYLKPINDRYPIKSMPKDAVIIGVVRSQEKRYK